MARKIHINAIISGIDELFSERILKSELSDKDELIPKRSRIDGVDYVWRKFDTRDKKALERKAEVKLKAFLPRHPDNTFELFKETEIETAKEWQTYFPKYKTDSLHKTYYNHLQRWISFLESKINPEKTLQ